MIENKVPTEITTKTFDTQKVKQMYEPTLLNRYKPLDLPSITTRKHPISAFLPIICYQKKVGLLGRNNRKMSLRKLLR